MLFLQISRHNPESCPVHNQAAKKASDNLNAKTDHIMKKHGIRMIGGWVAIPEHLNVLVFDAPDIDALMNAAMEPEMMAWIGYNTSQLMPVITLEETTKM